MEGDEITSETSAFGGAQVWSRVPITLVRRSKGKPAMHTEIPPLSEVKKVNDKSLIFLSLISFLEEYNLSSGIQILSGSS